MKPYRWYALRPLEQREKSEPESSPRDGFKRSLLIIGGIVGYFTFWASILYLLGHLLLRA